MSELSELRSATIFRRKAGGLPRGRWKLEVRYAGQPPKITTWDTRREAQHELAHLKALSKVVVDDGPKRPFADYAEQWMQVQEHGLSSAPLSGSVRPSPRC